MILSVHHPAVDRALASLDAFVSTENINSSTNIEECFLSAEIVENEFEEKFNCKIVFKDDWGAGDEIHFKSDHYKTLFLIQFGC